MSAGLYQYSCPAGPPTSCMKFAGSQVNVPVMIVGLPNGAPDHVPVPVMVTARAWLGTATAPTASAAATIPILSEPIFLPFISMFPTKRPHHRVASHGSPARSLHAERGNGAA